MSSIPLVFEIQMHFLNLPSQLHRLVDQHMMVGHLMKGMGVDSMSKELYVLMNLVHSRVYCLTWRSTPEMT